MNILHLSTAKNWRGGEQQVDYLIQSLSPYVDKQILLCVEGSALSNRIKEAEIETLKKPFFFSFSWIKKINRICKEHNIDVIHIHESKAQTLGVLSSVLYKLNASIIVTRRVIFQVKGFFSRLKYKTSHIKKIVCISNAVMEEMQKNVPEHKLKVIPSVVSPLEFDSVDRKRFDFLDESKFNIGYIAALTSEKDHYTFVNTARLVLAERKDVKFYIVGSGKLEKDIQDYVQKHQLQNNIIFTGFIENVKSLIVQLDMLLFTSESEGLGSTVLDFFAAQKPVVATDSKGLRDVVINSQTGVLCEVGDAESLKNGVLKMITDENFKNRMVDNAYSLLLKKFTISTMGKQYYSLYNDLLNNKKN